MGNYKKKLKYKHDIIDKKFGFLTVLEQLEERIQNRITFLCKCDCGKLLKISGDRLVNRGVKSCHCRRNKKYKELPGDKPEWYKGFKEISWRYYKSIFLRARNKKRKFTVTIEEIWDLFVKQDRKCALSGLSICFSAYVRGTDRTASLDRIDSKEGYITNNIQWTHKDINNMKQDYTEEEFINYCKLVSNHKK